MKKSIAANELNKLPTTEKDRSLRELVQAAKSAPNGEVRDLSARIAAYESKFGISSAQLRAELAQGKRAETWEVVQWLMLLDQRDLLDARTARAH